MNNSNQELRLHLLTTEQKAVATAVLKTIIDWISGSENYKPLRMTVSAGAGRGKSFLIHQLSIALRQIFGRMDVVKTAAFTGSAAFNVGGSTCHSAFGISPMNPDQELTEGVRPVSYPPLQLQTNREG